MTTERTVKELILQASEPENLCPGFATTKVYSLPDARLTNYLLRVPRPIVTKEIKSIKELLETTTSLYPAYLCDRNFGQILLNNQPQLGYDDLQRGFQIVLKTPGTSLYDIGEQQGVIYKQQGRDFQDSQRAITAHVLDILSTLPVSSFEGIMKDINYLTKQDIAADLHWGNILLDGNTLRLIDVHCAPYHDGQDSPADNNLGNLKKGLMQLRSASEAPLPAVKEKNLELLKTLNKKLGIAAARTGFPRNKQEAIAMAPQSLNAVRAIKPINTKFGAALPLSARTSDLSRMLQTLNPVARQ